MGLLDTIASMDTSKIKNVENYVSFEPVINSISSQASKTTYYFPVLVSSSVDPKSAYLVSSNLEYMYAYFMQSCFALTPAIKVRGDINVEEYLKRFHKNTGVNEKYILVPDFANIVKSLQGMSLSEGTTEEFKLFKNDILNIGIDGNVVLNEAPHVLDSRGIKTTSTTDKNGHTITTDVTETIVQNGDRIYKQTTTQTTDETGRILKSNTVSVPYNDGADKDFNKIKNDALKRQREEDKRKWDNIQKKRQLDKWDEEDRAAAEKEARDAEAHAWEAEDKKIKDTHRYFGDGTKLVTDFSKRNQIQPTIIPVTCTFLQDTHEIKVNIPIGIKTVLHTCPYNEIIDRLSDSVRGHGIIKSFVRYTSGEVNSLGDILLGTTNMKNDIAGKSPLGKWFDIVERRKRINKLSLGLASKKPFLPNMTIQISMEDVIEIERRTRVNLLKNLKFTNKLIYDCLLLSFVITDDATETAYVLYEGHGSFEEMPYSSLKRENEKQSSLMDNLLRTLGRM